LLPIPSSAKKIAQDWKAGVEFFISNNVSGQKYPITDVSIDKNKKKIKKNKKKNINEYIREKLSLYNDIHNYNTYNYNIIII